jgi:hypothetical protein
MKSEKMKKILANFFAVIAFFVGSSGLAYAGTTMSQEGQYIFNSLGFYVRKWFGYYKKCVVNSS